MKLLVMLVVLFSDSCAFSYQMIHGLSVLYPIGYLLMSVAFLALPVFRK